jgi:hypothetical protein
MTFCVAAKLQQQVSQRPLLALLDSGSTTTWINHRSIPDGVQGTPVDNLKGSTLAGEFSSSEQITLHDFALPEFHSKRTLPILQARVFQADCRYDIIVGRDVLRAFGVSLDFDSNSIVSDSVSLPMRHFPTGPPNSSPVKQLLQDFGTCLSAEFDEDLFEDSYVMDSKYDAVLPETIANACTHLNDKQRNDLTQLFSKFPVLFNGQLKVFPDERIHLETDATVSPNRSRAYTVPHAHMDTFKKELDRLIEVGVLEKCGRANWVSGTFIIPKMEE